MERKENGMPNVEKAGFCELLPSSLQGKIQLASVYAPIEKWQMIYPIEKALSHGTLFEELYKPLEGEENG